MKDFVKNLITNLNDKIDKTPLMNVKSPKEYRNMGKEEIKHRIKIQKKMNKMKDKIRRK